ncbi:MAG TPA: hypothetical protein VKK31_16055 [Thermoanaerobaculia bacterium]|nr:hypothetical protein [Thermoanaerobaculia bacterium]
MAQPRRERQPIDSERKKDRQMPNKGSYAGFVSDCEKTLTNVKARAAELPDLSVYITPVEELLAETKAMGARQQSLQSVKQEETKKLQEVVVKAREAVVRLKAALKAHFGPKSERLVEFGMRPSRKRTRSPESGKKPKPVDDPAPASDRIPQQS